MTAIDYILDGLEAELELERELGVRVIACDRTLLCEEEQVLRAPAKPSSSPPPSPDPPQAAPVGQGDETRKVNPHFVFLHHAALSPKAVEMMAKIIGAMGETVESAPILFTGPLPKARVLVVLGGFALAKWFPSRKGAPGQWFRLDDGREVLVTYSPEYFLRFATITPAVQKMKRDMWLSLKALMQRIKSQT